MQLTVSLMLVAAAVAVAPCSFAQTQPQIASTGTPNTRLAAMVPAGMSAESACTGFKSLGECSTALHVSQNLSIPFADVRDRVASGQSLAAAVHALKPSADSRREVRRAESQAREDLKPLG